MPVDVAMRREWRGEYPEGFIAVSVYEELAFGWKVHRHFLPKGAVIRTKATNPVERSRYPNRTLHTMGRLVVKRPDGSLGVEKVPGSYSQEAPDHPGGVVTATAEEDSEFWCFNYTANRNALPQLEVIRLGDGQSLDLLQGQRVLICRGDVFVCGQLKQGPLSFVMESAGQITASGNAYGFLIASERVVES
jgi:hypothetical protein